MGATFTYAVRYWVTAKCVTPLRTAGADGDTETVLTTVDGIPFLQGSSIAGALKHWLKSTEEANMADALLGSPKQTGSLIVSDGRFASETRSIRPRLRINPKTGSAASGGKFDLAQVNAGSAFSFTLTWLGHCEKAYKKTDKENSELACIESMLSALDTGAVCLGGQKSNGFGRVTLTVKKQTYDMRQEQDRQAWLEDRDGGDEISLPRKKTPGTVTFTISGQADSILVKSSYTRQIKDGSYTMNLTEDEIPILPGSSVKGAVRARAALIAAAAGHSPELVTFLFGREAIQGEDNGQAGQVRFEDVRLDTNNMRKISRIRINRFTGGVMRGGLFTEEPLCSKINMTITAPDSCPEACALLLYALRDLGLGLYNLGSGGAIGRGYLHVEKISIEAGGQTAELTFSDGFDRTLSAPNENKLIEEWMNAWKEGCTREN